MPTILVLAANPNDTQKLHWEEEIKLVRDALRRTAFDVVAIPQADIASLQSEFHSYQPRIVHFVGHGELEGLLFNDTDGYAQTVPPQALADLFRLFKHSEQCVLLNACWSAAQAAAIHQHIPVVIGMSEAVADQAALHFAQGFYSALSENKNYREAFDFGHNQMHLHGGEQHNVPVLLCRDAALSPQVYINPYKGLAAFRQADQHLFFGREREIAALLDWISSERDNTAPSGVIPENAVIPQHRFLALVGVSGSGKSSVVFAGLAPRLEANWQVLECRPENNPFNRLALAFVRLLYSDKIEQATQLSKLEQNLSDTNVTLPALIQIWRSSSFPELVEGSFPELVEGSFPELVEGQRATAPNLLLIIDQFEELYTLNDKTTQQAFLDCLLALIHSDAPATLLITLRADFLNHAIAYPDFAAALNDHTRFISSMNRSELREVIEQPAQLAGLSLEQGLSERILDDISPLAEMPIAVAESVEVPVTELVEVSGASTSSATVTSFAPEGRLPLLQFALDQLFEQQMQGELTLQGYQQIGGVEKALAQYAEQQFQTFSSAQQTALRQVFVQLVHPGQGAEDTRRVATQQDLQAHWDLVQNLANKRLVVTGHDEKSQQDTVEVVHEALLKHWRQLRQWMDADRAFRIEIRRWLNNRKPNSNANVLC